MTETVIHLENELVRFGFDRATGCISELYDKRTQRTHLTRQDGARLFRIVCPSEKWATRYADAQDCDPPEIEVSNTALRLHYSHVRTLTGNIDIDVAVDVVLPHGDSEARFRLELVNNSTDLIHEVRFPWIGGWERYGGLGADRALAGCRPLDPHPTADRVLSFNIGGANRRSFHGMEIVMVPMFDLSGPDAGISYVCYHREPILGGFVTENLESGPVGNNYAFSWVSIPFVRPGESWRSPETGISLHDGNWRVTADRYRDAIAEWWQAPPAPDHLATTIGCQVFMPRTFTGKPNFRFRDISKVAEIGLKYGVTDLSVWDPIAALYARPDDGTFWEQYDPDEPISDLRQSLEEARRQGANVSTLVNYRLIRTNSSIYREIGDAVVQRGLHGTPLPEDWSHLSDYHASVNTKYLSRDSRPVCQRSPTFRKMARETTDLTMSLGFTSLFIDQTFDLNPCFATDHGHKSPSDTPAAVIEWVAEEAARVRALNKDAYVIGENLDVFVAQHINVSWVWMWAALAPEVMRYVLPETVMCWIVDRQPEVANLAFAFGSYMAFTTNELTGTLDDYPEFAEHIKRLATLRQRTEAFVARGRFRHTIGLETDHSPAFVYESDAGLAVVFAETKGTDVTTQVTLDTSFYDGKFRPNGSVIRSRGSDVRIGAARSDGIITAQIELAPLEVAVWMLDRV